ncbi:MAG: response regulator [Myxacorys chilensis ATA2-1-KO14]|jgi:twitching motility two-component system response regulator PilG|nr:response regulator [Myxacorys chilensis ATA2-1-KO14]
MQGQLSEIDIRSILQLIELGQRTGELFVQGYPTCSSSFGGLVSPDIRLPQSIPSWFIFFLNGQIVYAGETESDLSRLRDYLRRYKAETTLDRAVASAIAPFNTPEYGYLWSLLEAHLLTPAQGRSILQNMVHETLFDLLSLPQGSFTFELGTPLTPQLTTLEIAPLVTNIIKQVQEWKQLQPHLQSPDQCPIVANAVLLREALPETTFQTLDRYADGQISLRKIARYLNRDILTVARAIYPYVQRGWLQLTHPSSEEFGANRPSLSDWRTTRVPRVVCIDDGATVRKAVEYILDQHGYEVSTIDDPLKALSLVFQLKPDLILCDISMPELDGYELCAMLHQSTAFRQTPIVMLTGKDGFIDRVKARMVGAVDYLTKPFGKSELLMLVEKYVGQGQPEPFNPHDQSTHDLEELKLNIT